jgi:hypothetical protein
MADVVDEAESPETTDQETPRSRRPLLRVTVVLVVFALLAGVLIAKVLVPRPSLTSTQNDATADYEAAVATGKPVYVLFHSLT